MWAQGGAVHDARPFQTQQQTWWGKTGKCGGTSLNTPASAVASPTRIPRFVGRIYTRPPLFAIATSPSPAPPPPPAHGPAMSSVVETRQASPTLEKSRKVSKKEETPIDIDIPDNYVSWTLRNSKPAPPITMGNLLQNIQWISLLVLTITPSLAIYGALTVPLQWKTAVWSVVYYFITGLGTSLIRVREHGTLIAISCRYNCRLSPSLGSPRLQRVPPSPILLSHGRNRCRRRLHQVVVSWTPCSPPLHRHRARPVQRTPWFLLGTYGLDDSQAKTQDWRCRR